MRTHSRVHRCHMARQLGTDDIPAESGYRRSRRQAHAEKDKIVCSESHPHAHILEMRWATYKRLRAVDVALKDQWLLSAAGDLGVAH